MNMIAHKPRSLSLTVALIAIAQHCSHALAYDTVTHAAADFTGMWKQDCEEKFGLQIKPASDDLYSVSFCGPGGCFKPGTYRPNTKIVGDSMYEVLSNSALKIKQVNGTFALYRKCSADPTPTNPKILN